VPARPFLLRVVITTRSPILMFFMRDLSPSANPCSRGERPRVTCATA
jgi:hypothetical protein